VLQRAPVLARGARSDDRVLREAQAGFFALLRGVDLVAPRTLRTEQSILSPADALCVLPDGAEAFLHSSGNLLCESLGLLFPASKEFACLLLDPARKVRRLALQ